MNKKPYHHLPDGTFRNVEGSPKRDPNIKWSYKVFNAERKKIKIDFPKDHVVPREQVLKNLEKIKNEDYVAWIGHATFLIKLGNTTIITDPVFSKNTGPLIFGPKRYVDPAIKLKEIPKIDLFLLTHNHYDHQDMSTIRNFPYKKAKVIVPLKLSKYFKRFNDVNELDWYEEIIINKDIKVTLLPAVHWSRRGLFDTNKTLWGSFLIEYKNKKIFFACDTGYSNIYKLMGQKFGGVDIFLINSGAYNFEVITGKKDFSIFHTNPEEALQVAKDIKAKKVIPMHYGSFLLGLEGQNSEGPINEPRNRLLKNAENYGFKKKDIKIFNIGQISTLDEILND